MKYFFHTLHLVSLLLIAKLSACQHTRQDSLRGSITQERAWWDVIRYHVDVTPDYATKTIKGFTRIEFNVLRAGTTMQIDLQQPLEIDSVCFIKDGKKTWISDSKQRLRREGNVYFIKVENFKPGSTQTIGIAYHGKPRQATNPPWDGGWIWRKDEQGNPWMSVACQGLGASVWFPCKDHQSDEPDKGASLRITAADTLTAVGNGRLIKKENNNDGTTSWTWEVKNPINNYNIIPYIGKYATWHDEYAGAKGKLDLDYWVLAYNVDKAKAQFGRDVKPMLQCFEDWFGPYPFYEDGYKLVESPHLGMEHQSAVAYGNRYMNGYLGMDLSGSGWGNKWDYIIIHESGHEWFGNNITTKDIADMWVHEGFTDYSEPLFVECLYGKQAADEYCQGLRRNISNDIPVIGPYGVNKEGSGDMYAKGANLLHTIRQIINNDSLFKQILRGLNKDFYHKTTTSKEVENYISKKAGIDFSKVFDQYLRTTMIPILEYKIKGKSLTYRWTNTVAGFDMPVRIVCGDVKRMINVSGKWQTQALGDWFNAEEFMFDPNFYIETRKLDR